MKKFIILFLFITATMFSQGWNNVVQTTIPVTSHSRGVDIFSNKDGNNIIVNYVSPYPYTFELKYYLTNTSGTTIRSYTFETQGVDFASIDGSDGRIYVVYKLGNQIKTKKSTNAGQSWSNIAEINIGSNTCNNVDITFGKDDNALHVVWATQDAGSDYKTYYGRLYNDAWSSIQEVTDGSNIGGFPTVSKSLNRVHVSYNTKASEDPWYSNGEAKTRDKYSLVWQTPQNVFYPSFREKIHAGISKLFDFYYVLHTGPRADMYVKERNLNETTWSSSVLLQTYADPGNLVPVVNTTDGKTHIIYVKANFGFIGYRSYNGTWSSESEIGDYPDTAPFQMSSVSNDLFAVWRSGGYLSYRQYDANPLTPSNFALTVHSEGGSGYPKITWSLNNEPDVRACSTAYFIERRIDRDGTGRWSIWDPLVTLAGDVNQHIDYTLPGAGSGPSKAQYQLKAMDVGNNFSSFTSPLQISYGTGYWKIGNSESDLPKEFGLQNNYPNPFNPSTTIKFAVSEEALVKIAVYDMLGREIAVLTNEQKQPGNYTIEWNAGNISSGVYIYRITALRGDKILFSESKRMILMK